MDRLYDAAARRVVWPRAAGGLPRMHGARARNVHLILAIRPNGKRTNANDYRL